MLTTEVAKQRAKAGAQYLDTLSADWPSRINLQTLDISSKCQCVLGQLTGDFDKAAGNLMPAEREDYGFEIGLPHQGELIPQYRVLTAAWLALIAARQAA